MVSAQSMPPSLIPDAELGRGYRPLYPELVTPELAVHDAEHLPSAPSSHIRQDESPPISILPSSRYTLRSGLGGRPNPRCRGTHGHTCTDGYTCMCTYLGLRILYTHTPSRHTCYPGPQSNIKGQTFPEEGWPTHLEGALTSSRPSASREVRESERPPGRAGGTQCSQTIPSRDDPGISCLQSWLWCW